MVAMPTKTNKQTKKSLPKNHHRPAHGRLHEKLRESDATYFLKLVVILILATLWLRLKHPINLGVFVVNALPLGIVLGVIGVKLFEKFQSDRKIWYAILLIVGILGFFVPGVGIVI